MSSICNSSTLEIRYATGSVGVAPLIKFVIVEFEIDAFCNKAILETFAI